MLTFPSGEVYKMMSEYSGDNLLLMVYALFCKCFLWFLSYFDAENIGLSEGLVYMAKEVLITHEGTNEVQNCFSIIPELG